MTPLHIFRAAEPAVGVYDTALWGIFQREGFPEWIQFLLLGSFALAVLFWVMHWATQKRAFHVATLASGTVGFLCVCFLLNNPWDEIFVNLRHSVHLAEEGLFSFNRHESIEALVDFLPYFAIGLLAKLGFDPFALALLMSAGSGVACLFIARAILLRLGFSTVIQNGAFLLLCVFPPLCFNSAQGFATTFFAAWILLSIYFYFFSENKRAGLVFVALLPLVRVEGLFLTFLFWVHLLFYSPKTKKDFLRVIRTGILLVLPIGILSVYRWSVFGTALPVPVLYKSSFGNIFYLKQGIRNFARDYIVGFGLLTAPLILLGFALIKDRSWRRSLWPFAAVTLFVLPYYLSGGDWFPSFWGRYLLPLTLLSSIFALAATVKLCADSQYRVPTLVALILFTFFYTLNPKWNATGILKRDLFGKLAGQGSLRLQQLSQVGYQLNRSTLETDVIASSELATLMYFANREALDLLGIASNDIYKEPLMENSNLAFRRRKPSLIEERRPEIIWPYDYTTFASETWSTEEIVKEVEKRTDWYRGSHDFRFGGVENLSRLGYQPVVLLMQDFSTLYFVSSEAFPRHRQALLDLGFQGDEPAPTRLL